MIMTECRYHNSSQNSTEDIENRHNHSAIRVAYLNTRYPALSHTFIENEIRAVREQGVEVHTFSIRRPAESDLLSHHHRDAEKNTFYILDGLASFVISLFHGIYRPVQFLSCLLFAQKISPPGLKMRFLHIVYALESIRFALEMHRRNLQHIHVHMANNGATVALLACIYDRSLEYSMTIHGSDEFFHVDRFYLKIKTEKACFVRCISNFCKAQIMIWSNPDKWRDYHIIHCGVDTERFKLNSNGKEKFTILFVGRLEPIKGLTVLLEAVQGLVKSGIDCRLDIVGDGPMKGVLSQMTNQMGLDGHVIFNSAVGHDEIMVHYERAHVLVISSFMEGIPVVLMEAMAKGLPVVATNVGGITELVENNSNGFVVPAGSPDKLFQALKLLADNQDCAIRMGIKGREKLIQEFSIANLGNEMFILFDKYLRKQDSSASAS
jgi:colanic acid/amylovoran biosynthesis glycosyltransferase